MPDYPMRCDVCGFRYPSSQIKRRWDGLYACIHDWESRQPQDFVRGRKDRQQVPVVRNDDIDLTDTTTLNADAAKGATTITVASAANISQFDAIGVVLDDDSLQWTFTPDSPVGNNVTLTEKLRGAAASGNTVYYPGSAFPDDITADDL